MLLWICLLSNFVYILGQSDDVNSTATSGTLSSNYSGKKSYRIERHMMVDYFSAFAHCLTHGGRLASIESEEDNVNIKAEIAKSNLRNANFWTSGANYPQADWVWMTSRLPYPAFTDWHTGEPNNFGENGEEEHCMEISEKFRNGYKWNDVTCWLQIRPICEFFE